MYSLVAGKGERVKIDGAKFEKKKKTKKQKNKKIKIKKQKVRKDFEGAQRQKRFESVPMASIITFNQF